MNKKFAIPLALALSLVLVSAVAITYFKQTEVGLTVTEARESADLPFELSCFSGETQTHEITVTNKANVALDSQISVTENSNENNVTYTVELPGVDGRVTTDATTTGTYPVSVTCDEITEPGFVNLTVNYAKIK